MPSKKIDGYLFQFYSSDENEPVHIHVKRSGNVAKIWLDDFAVEYNRGYSEPDLNKIVRLAREHYDELVEMWNEHFS